jgi:ElaB/YqjD/DUF883 family membrane-anchored ribosome-binding protein
MGQSSDQLRQEIDQHRHDAERKINDLQGTIEGTADDLKVQAQSTVEDVKHQVQDTVDETVRTVTENVDIEGFVRERPLVSLGAALIGGFMLGGMLDSSRGSSSSSRSYEYSGERGDMSSGGSSSGGSDIGGTIRNVFKSSGLEDTVNNAAAAMMGSVTEQLKQTMDRNMPGFANKMDTAKHTDGTVMDKSRNVQP